MADTGTATLTIEEPGGGFRRYVIAWTSDASSGKVEKSFGDPLRGFILNLGTVPGGTDGPSGGYDITMQDDKGIEFLEAAGDNKSASASDIVPVKLSNDLAVALAIPSFVFKVDDAGNSKSGTVLLTMKG